MCFRDGMEIAVVYFRTCYEPKLFADEKVTSNNKTLYEYIRKMPIQSTNNIDDKQ